MESLVRAIYNSFSQIRAYIDSPMLPNDYDKLDEYQKWAISRHFIPAVEEELVKLIDTTYYVKKRSKGDQE